jgi:hypothetical protein
MKNFLLLTGVFFLSSCGEPEKQVENTPIPVTEETLRDKTKVAGKEIREAWDASLDASGKAVEDLNDNTREARDKAWEATKSAAGKTGEFIQENAAPVAEWTKEKAAKAGELAQEGLTKAKDALPPKEELQRVGKDVKDTAGEAWRYLREKAAEAIKPDSPTPEPGPATEEP